MRVAHSHIEATDEKYGVIVGASARDAEDPRINPDGTAGWLISGVSGSWEFEPGYTVSAALDNLGDKNYRVHGSGIDATGRSAMLMIDVEL